MSSRKTATQTDAISPSLQISLSFFFFVCFLSPLRAGFKKEEAYKRTHDAMKAERAADLATIRRRVKEASVLAGARPSFVADDDVYSGLRYWQTMMHETP